MLDTEMRPWPPSPSEAVRLLMSKDAKALKSRIESDERVDPKQDYERLSQITYL